MNQGISRSGQRHHWKNFIRGREKEASLISGLQIVKNGISSFIYFMFLRIIFFINFLYMENILLCLVVINLVILALFLYRIEKLLENLRHELQQGSGDINEQIK